MEPGFSPLLVVDDEEAARYAARRLFESDYHVLEAASAEEARPILTRERPLVVLLDFNLPGEDGLSLLREINSQANPPAVILLTAYGSERLAVQALKSGAYDYLAKPYDIQELRAVVARAAERQELRSEVENLRGALAAEGQFGAMIGDSPPMREVFRMAVQVAPTNLPVLLLGESGTGKDLLARAIHESSLRSRARFVALNCSALPESLVESELFGYQKGAFTGAVQSCGGRFEAAHRGTIFLDEVADLALTVQPKLLRVAESGTFERLGASSSTQVDVRVLSATNADLPERVRQGSFREDLYYRLAGATLRLPPLRERGDDVLLLTEHFWQALRRKYPGQARTLHPDARLRLRTYPWPGNVRQLRNFLEKLFVLARAEVVDANDVDLTLRSEAATAVAGGAQDGAPSPEPDDYREARRRFEEEFFRQQLRKHQGNISHTAKKVGLERQTLQDKLKALGIQARDQYAHDFHGTGRHRRPPPAQRHIHRRFTASCPDVPQRPSPPQSPTQTKHTGNCNLASFRTANPRASQQTPHRQCTACPEASQEDKSQTESAAERRRMGAMKQRWIRALKWSGACIVLILVFWGAWTCRIAIGGWLFQASAPIQAVGSIAAAIAAFCAWRTSEKLRGISERGTEAAIASAEAARLSAGAALKVAEIEEWNLRRNAKFTTSAELHFNEGDRAPVLEFVMDNPVTTLCKSAIGKVYTRYDRVFENLPLIKQIARYNLPFRNQAVPKNGKFSFDVGEAISEALYYVDTVQEHFQLPFALMIECEFYFAEGIPTFSEYAALVVDWEANQGWFVRKSALEEVQSQVFEEQRIDSNQTGVLADQYPGGPAVGPFRPDLQPPGERLEDGVNGSIGV